MLPVQTEFYSELVEQVWLVWETAQPFAKNLRCTLRGGGLFPHRHSPRNRRAFDNFLDRCLSTVHTGLEDLQAFFVGSSRFAFHGIALYAVCASLQFLVDVGTT